MNRARFINHGDFFHYMDHLNRTSFGDPLLIKSKSKGTTSGYIVTAIIGLAGIGLFFLSEVIKHA